jgi:hypothetical protein
MIVSETPIQEDDFGRDSTTLGPADGPPGVPVGSAGPSNAEEADPDADADADVDADAFEATVSPADQGDSTA